MCRGSSSILTACAVWTPSLETNRKRRKGHRRELVNLDRISSSTWCRKMSTDWSCTGDADESVNRCLLITSLEEGSCSAKEVRGSVGGQHGRQQTADTLVWDGAAEDKHRHLLTMNPLIIHTRGSSTAGFLQISKAVALVCVTFEENRCKVP